MAVVRRTAATVAALVVIAVGSPSLPAAAAPVTNQPCVNGMAAGRFPCSNVDLKTFIPIADLGGGSASDIWGWKDPDTGREYALMGSTRGVHFVDITNTSQPVYLGNLAKGDPVGAVWQDLEVFKNHLYVVCDLVPCGLQIFDLSRLRGAQAPQTWMPDLVYPVTAITHTLDINPETGFLYLNGAYLSGGSHVVDINIPKAPVPAGVIQDDGYTHDTHCRIYRGPDARFSGKEICFAFNEDTINVYDVSLKASPRRLARVTYERASYTHSGWLTQDHRYLLVDDETDGRNVVFIWDVSLLDAPKLIGTYTGPTRAIDHNVYIKGTHAYLANYEAGMRILETSQVGAGTLTEIAYFDVVHPAPDTGRYEGSWSVYPYLPSGNVLISGMRQGLFVVDPTIDNVPSV